MNRLIQYVKDLVSFTHEAWPLVRRRRQMEPVEYERAKEQLLTKYAR